MPNRARRLLEIFLISMAAILLEIAFTRVFSFKLYYYFTYLIIGLAMLGLGAGGVLAAVLPSLRRAKAESAVTYSTLVAALLVPVGYLLVALVQVNTIDLVDEPTQIMRLGLVSLALFAPFLAIGIALAVVFGSRPEEMNRLYSADLLGAGLGCAICVPVFTESSPPTAIMGAGWLLAAACVTSSWQHGKGIRSAALATLVLSSLAVGFAGQLPDLVADRTKTMSPQRRGDLATLYSNWSALFRVDVLPSGGVDAPFRWLVHDGNAGSGFYRFDGDFSKLTRYDSDIRSKPFSVLDPDPGVLIIGSAGGQEILASLYFGAESVTAVELNPVTVGLLRGEFADFTGRIAFDERVELINAEGRSFLERSEKRFDLVWFVAPDSYSALNAASSGAFVMSESYLFTVEMIKASLEHLSEDGIICVQWGELHADRKRAVRYLATVRRAFDELGIEGFQDHVIVTTAPGLLPTSTLMVGRKPFDAESIAGLRAQLPSIKKSRLWHPGGSDTEHPIARVLNSTDADLERWLDGYTYDVAPVTDDSPFFWHFTRFRDAFDMPWRAHKDVPDWEVATGEQTLLILLGLAVVFAAVFLLLPLATVRSVWAEIPGKKLAALYFGGLGLGFMFIEVCLIQKLSLFLGYPTYSLTVTLFSLLIFSGIGSLLSSSWVERFGVAMAGAGGLIAVLTLLVFYVLGLDALVNAALGTSFAIRALITIVVLAPLGICLGAFMPLGIHVISGLSTHQREYVAWAWAVNGFFSVVSSVLSAIVAMSMGFDVLLALGAISYTVAVLSLRRLDKTDSPATPAAATCEPSAEFGQNGPATT